MPYQSETSIFLSDIDEIPDMETYNGKYGVFQQGLYYYAFNIFTGLETWNGTIVVKKKNLISFNTLRTNRGRLTHVGKGWHFSTLGTTEMIREKIEAFSHQEFNTDYIKNNLDMNRSQLMDPYERHVIPYIIQMPAGPKWLIENKDKYPQFFAKGTESMIQF
jgi:beta-1,4-mannosyl-glycoprotein beta-1,4-N-acetylglucosaminyltransferase